MKNRTRIIAIITILLCVFIYPLMKSSKGRVNAEEIQIQKLGSLFQGTGCTWLKTHVNAWALVGNLPLPMTALENRGLEIGEFLELKDGFELLKNHHNGTKQVSIKGFDEKGINYDIIITNTRYNNNSEISYTYDTHVIINALMDYTVTDNNSMDNTSTSYDTIENYFESIGKPPQISTTYTGAFQGEASKRHKKNILKKLIQEINGEPNQTMEDDDIMSVAGYSPVIQTAPIENINFHIALRYSEYTDLTYLWMGSPIITIEY